MQFFYSTVMLFLKVMKIFVKVKPRAPENVIKKIDGIHYTVWTKEAPEKGKANEAVAQVLAAHFEIAPSRIRLISGFSSKQKVFEIL